MLVQQTSLAYPLTVSCRSAMFPSVISNRSECAMVVVLIPRATVKLVLHPVSSFYILAMVLTLIVIFMTFWSWFLNTWQKGVVQRWWLKLFPPKLLGIKIGLLSNVVLQRRTANFPCMPPLLGKWKKCTATAILFTRYKDTQSHTEIRNYITPASSVIMTFLGVLPTPFTKDMSK